MPTVTAPVGSGLVGFLLVDEHAHHRVGVSQLAVFDEEREAPEMVGLGDDDPLGSAVGDLEVGGDGVGVAVDPRDHP